MKKEKATGNLQWEGDQLMQEWRVKEEVPATDARGIRFTRYSEYKEWRAVARVNAKGQRTVTRADNTQNEIATRPSPQEWERAKSKLNLSAMLERVVRDHEAFAESFKTTPLLSDEVPPSRMVVTKLRSDVPPVAGLEAQALICAACAKDLESKARVRGPPTRRCPMSSEPDLELTLCPDCGFAAVVYLDEPEGFWADCQCIDAPIWGETEEECIRNWNDVMLDTDAMEVPDE
ncbi:MAG: hypothetical protein JJU29_07445 [Verrucomicrobia bacterium]|nr:hypothetical protein [Verrucomicrobiota bacterium]